MKKKTILGTGAAFFAVPATMVLACGPAFAASSGDVIVSNTETVQAYLDATGHLDTARVYEQVAMQGKGTVDLSNPVEAKGLRNLDGFGGFSVKNGNMVGTYTVDGEKRLRSVSDYTKRLPLAVEVTYTLDGKTVKPGDVVGKSGNLKVQYTVTNMTGQAQTVSFNDGTGATTSASEDVVIPMVGSLSTVLPSTFTDVRSGEANIAGDGRGGTKMSFTMTLFGPIGKPQATFGYEAKITDGVIPKTSISALPVSPLDSPSFKGGAESYKGGAETGATLTAGATEIDSNLLKLRDGAGDLLAGLIKLRDGASQLNDGLAGQAAPGAAALATGAGQLKDGTEQLSAGAAKAKDGSAQVSGGAGQLAAGAGKLDDGAAKLADGSTKLAAGTHQLQDGANRLAGGAADASVGADALADGSAQVADGLAEANSKAPALIDGLAQVSDGLKLVDKGLVTMYDSIGALDENAGVLKMHEGMGAMIAGLGSTTQPATLIGGVEKVRSGLAAATADGSSLDQLKGGVDASAQGASDVSAGLTNAIDGIAAVKKGNDDALATGGSIDEAAAAISDIKKVPSCAVDPLCSGTVDATAAGIKAKLTKSATDASNGLGQINGGLSGTAIPGLAAISSGLSTKVSPGLAQLKTNLSDAAVGLARIECGLSNESLDGVCDPAKPGLLEGIGSVDAGVTQLVNTVMTNVQAGIGGASDTKEDATLRGGVHSLQAGVGLLSAGGSDLLSGLGLLGAGAGLVAEGNADLADGVSQLAGGADQIAGGSADLRGGADQLAAGSGQLAGGTGDLRTGANKLADGAGQLDSGLGTLSSGAGKLDAGAGDLSAGAGRLSDGLTGAADGSGQLADGLAKAADGAPALKDGAQKLSDEGTKKLVAAGKSTAADYGQKYALIEAGAQRAKAEGMAYGAPTDAVGNTAYSYELAGADGEGGRNLGRGVGALAVFGLAGGAAFLRRRFI